MSDYGYPFESEKIPKERIGIKELLKNLNYTGFVTINAPFDSWTFECINGNPLSIDDKFRNVYLYGVTEIACGAVLIKNDFLHLHLVDWGTIDKHNQVIFNPPATILYKDGKKYVSKCDSVDEFDEEKGLMICLLKSCGYKYGDIKRLLESAKRFGDKE